MQVDILNEALTKILPDQTEEIKIKDNLIAYCDSGVEVDLVKLADFIDKKKDENFMKENCVSKSAKPFEDEINGQDVDSIVKNEKGKLRNGNKVHNQENSKENMNNDKAKNGLFQTVEKDEEQKLKEKINEEAVNEILGE